MSEREQTMMAEIERLQRRVDAAFSHACAGDAHAARVELTEARWGAWSAKPEGERAC